MNKILIPYIFLKKNKHLINQYKNKELLNKLKDSNKLQTIFYKASAIQVHNLLWFILRRIRPFFLKKSLNWHSAFLKWFKKRRYKLRFRRNLRIRLTSFRFVKKALERVTGIQTFCFFYIISWDKKKYNSLKDAFLFERSHTRRFFNHLVLATHVAFSHGATSVLTDCVRNLLSQSGRIRHAKVLDLLHDAVRYWLCYWRSTRVRKGLVCQGAKLEIIGIIDGAERSKTWRVTVGTLPSSSNKAAVCYDQSAISTKYGVVHFHVWLFFYSNTTYSKIVQN